MKKYLSLYFFGIIALVSCNNNSDEEYEDVTSYPFIEAEFGSSINLENLANATYFLKILSADKELKIVKIIKN